MVDEIATVKFVYIQWVGEGVKPMSKAKISTHKGDIEKIFYVSSFPVPSDMHTHTHLFWRQLSHLPWPGGLCYFISNIHTPTS